MKKLTLLFLLVVGLVFMGCESESITGDEYNSSTKELANQQQNSSTKELANQQQNSSTKELENQQESSSTKELENQQENSSTFLDFNIEVYVDYSGVASQFGTPESVVPPGTTMKGYIIDYQTEMSMNFTIHEIQKSTSCDYIFKWVVSHNEYYEYWGPEGPPSSEIELFGGSKNPLQTPKEEDDTGFFDQESVIDPYLDCFN